MDSRQISRPLEGPKIGHERFASGTFRGMNFDERIVTDAPPSGAFLYLSDLTNAPSWDPSITRVEQCTPGVVGLGTEFRVTMRLMGVHTTLDYHVEVYEPGRRVMFMGRSLITKVTDCVIVTPFRGGSRIRWTSDIHLFAPLVLLDPIFGMLFRPTMTKGLACLRESLNRLAPSMGARVVMPEPVPIRPMPPPPRDMEAFRAARHG